jgi:hypothetical protein
MRESREKKNYKQEHIHSVTVDEKEEKKKKKRIPNETIRLGIDTSEKDLDCMLASFFSFFFFVL